MKKIILLLLLLSAGLSFASGISKRVQSTLESNKASTVNLVNSGAKIVLGNGTRLVIDGSYRTNSNGTLTIGTNSGVDLSNQFVNGNSSVNPLTSSSAGQVVFKGGSVQTIDGNPTQFYGLKISNPQGVLLNQNTSTEKDLELSTGFLNTGSYNLTLGSSAAFSGSSSGFVKATNGGTVTKKLAAKSMIKFPLADANGAAGMTPLTLNFTKGTFNNSQVTVSVNNSKLAATNDTTHLKRTWKIAQSGISDFSCDIQAAYLDADIVGKEKNICAAFDNGSAIINYGQADAANNLLNLTLTGFGTNGCLSGNLFSLAGNYTVGTGGDFANLTGAEGLFAAINSRTVTGDITATIISDLVENGATLLNQWAENGAGNYTLTIKPDIAATRTVRGDGINTNSCLIGINGASRVVIDGTNSKKLAFVGNSAFNDGPPVAVIMLNSAANCKITNCDISSSNINNGMVFGISTAGENNEISKNRLHDLTGSSSADIYGIMYYGSTKITNNMITLTPVTTGAVSGVVTEGGGALNLYYNSIYIGGTNTRADGWSAAVAPVVNDIFLAKNNIFYNARINSGAGSGGHYAIYFNSVTGSQLKEENYNLYYSATNCIGKFENKPDCATLADWQSATNGFGQDANSKSSVIQFENIASGDLSFKRVAANSAVFNTGVAVSGITEDFFGKARPQYAQEDIGAHELEHTSGLEENNLPTETRLTQNYPNPFNPVTRINYELRIADKVKLSIYNAKGEQVKTLVNGMQNAGRYSATFDGAGFNSGVYFYKLEADGKSIVKRMLMVK